MAKKFTLTNERAKQLLADIQVVQREGDDWRRILGELEETFQGIVDLTAESERVIFRVFPHDGQVIALFPDQYNERTGGIGSYTDHGQHAETAPDFGDTEAADPHAYASLLGELEQQGYSNLKIVKQFGKLGRKKL